MSKALARKHCMIACAMMDTGASANAIAQLTIAIKLNPIGLYFHHRGHAHMNLEEYQAAIIDFSTALELRVSQPELSHANRGQSFLALRMYEQAIDDFTRAIELDPGNADYYYQRGVALESLGLWRSAVLDFEAAIRIEATHRFARESLSALLATCPDSVIRDGRRAVSISDQLLQDECANWLTYAIAASAQAEVGNWEVAVQHAIVALKLSPVDQRRERELRLAAFHERRPHRRSKPATGSYN